MALTPNLAAAPRRRGDDASCQTARAVAARLVDMGDQVDLLEEAVDPREAPDLLAEVDTRREAEDLADHTELAVDHLAHLVTPVGRAAP